MGAERPLRLVRHIRPAWNQCIFWSYSLYWILSMFSSMATLAPWRGSGLALAGAAGCWPGPPAPGRRRPAGTPSALTPPAPPAPCCPTRRLGTAATRMYPVAISNVFRPAGLVLCSEHARRCRRTAQCQCDHDDQEPPASEFVGVAIERG
jgi:hypothetical protein